MASVKKKLKTDKFDPDVDLNINFSDFDEVAGINSELNKKKSRTPVSDVFSGTISGATSVLTDPQFIGSKVRKALPEQYGEAFDGVSNIAKTAGSLYDETVREIKPQAARIASKVDQLVPEERKKLKAATKRISRFFGNEEPLPQGPSKEARENEQISLAIGGIFTRQEKLNEELEAQRSAKDTVRDRIQDKRSMSMIDLLGRIDASTAAASQYKTHIEPNYQKKSLELQYRSYFTQVELLSKTSQYFEVFKAQNEAIARNTALPEYRKIHLDERFHDEAKKRLVNFAQNKLMDPNGFIGRVAANTKNEIKDYVQGFKDAMTGAEAMLGAYEQAKEMSEMGGEDLGMSKSKLMGHVAGAGIMDFLGDKGAKIARKLTEKHKPTMDMGYKLKNKFGNLEGEVADFLQTDSAKQFDNNDSLLGKFMKGIFGIGARSVQAGVSPGGGKLGEFGSLHDAVFFDKRSKVSLEVVIPGLLSRILRESTMLRTGKDAELIKYDLTSGQFSGGSKIIKSMEKSLQTQANATGQGIHISNLVADIQKGSQTRDVNTDREIARFFSDLSRKKGMRYTPENIRKDDDFGKLSEESQGRINRFFSTRIENGEDKHKEQADFTSAMIKIRASNANPEGEIRKMVDAGFAEELEKAGYITINEYGEWRINDAKFMQGIRERAVKFNPDDLVYKKPDPTMGTSDEAKKENISSASGTSGRKIDDWLRRHLSSALSAVEKTKVFNWKYRKGTGEDTSEAKTGPMAQEVKRNLGEDASPTGKEIDLVTMNGMNMLAIQELAKRQEEAMQDKSSDEILRGIYGKTSVIVELMQKRGFGGSGQGDGDGRDGSYTGEFKNISNSLFSILGKGTDDAMAAGKKVGGFTLKMGGKAVDLLTSLKDRYSDRFMKLADWAVDNTIDLTKKGLSFGKDLLTKHIPNGIAGVGKLLKKLGDKAKKLFDDARDIYVPGLGLVIQGARLRAGEYIDSATGKTLRTIEDVQNAVGDIKDATGAVVLSVKQRAQGLVDQFGIDIKVNFKSIRNAVIGGVARRLAKAGMTAVDILSSGKDMFGKLKSKIKNPFKDMDGISFGTKKIHNVLVQIRDLLTDKLGPIGDDYQNPWKDDSKSEPEGASNEPQYTGGSSLITAGGLKKHVIDRFKKQPGDTRSFKERAMGLKDSLLGKGKEFTDGLDPDLKQNLKDRFSRGGKLFSKIPGAGKVKGWGEKLRGKFSKPQSAGVASEVVDAAGSTGPVAGQLLLGYDSNVPSKNAQAEDISFKEKAVKPQGRFAKLRAKAGGLGSKLGGMTGMLGKAGGLAGKAVGALGGLAGMFAGGSESDPNDRVERPEDGKTEEKEVQGPVKRIGVTKATFNDKDGSGRRDGDAQDRREELEHLKAKRDAAAKAKASSDPKYMARESLMDGLLGKLGSLLSFAGSGLGKLFTGALSLFGKGAGGLLGGVGKAALGGVKALGGIGRGVLAVGSMAARIPGVGLAARAVGMVRNAALVTGLLSGGGLGTMVGAVGGLMSVLASPVVLGALAVGAVGYGAYKAYKYLTRDTVDPMEDIRMKQYGIGTGEGDKKFNHYVLQLENYFLDGRVGFDNGKAYILDKKVEADGLLEIMEIDKKDDAAVNKFTQWLQERFKPFFLNSCTAMRGVSDKLKIDKANTLSAEEKLKYLNLARFEGGPYDVSTSPFKELDRLNTDKRYAINAIDALIVTLKKELEKNQQKGKIPEVPKVAPKEDKVKQELQKPYSQDDARNRYNEDKKKSQEPANVGGEDGDAGNQAKSSDQKTSKGPIDLGTVSEIGGAIKDGKGGMKYIRTKPGVKLNLNPEMLKNLLGMAQEYGEVTGNSILITDGSRTYEEQKRLYDADPQKAAKPGFSSHEFGLAIDMNSEDANKLDKIGLMRKYGFTRPVGAEPWHVEPAGIQPILDQAKKDTAVATNAIVSGVGRGGGGYGTLPGARRYGRDIEVAMGLLNSDSAKKVTEEDIAAVAKYTAPKSLEPRIIPETKVAKAEPTVQPKTIKVADVTSPKPTLDPEKNKPVQEMAAVPTAPMSDSEGEKVADADGVVKGPAKDLKWDTKEDIKASIAKIATKNQVDPNAAVVMAAKESGLRPNARGEGSSAGLFGFVNATWNEQIGKSGKKFGISYDTPPTDPYASTALYTEYMNQNLKSIKSVRDNPSITDAYLTHLLGPAGARKFLAASPDEYAVNRLPTAAKNNPEYFYQDGKALTIKQVYEKIRNSLNKAAREYGVSIDVSKDQFDKNDRPETVASSQPAMVKTGTQISDLPGVSETLKRRDMLAEQQKRVSPDMQARQESITRQQARNAYGMTSNREAIEASSGRSVDPLVPLVKIADSQLSVTMEIRDILKEIANGLSPDQLKKLIGNIPVQGAEAAPQQPQRPARTPQQPERPQMLQTSLDVTRKSRA